MTRALLHARALQLAAPGGRTLFRDLSLVLERGERVALVGRNGVGKSTLLRVLAGLEPSERGVLHADGRRLLVPQLLEPAGARSPGQLRALRLAEAFDAEPDLLLLDEPTHDLDEAGRAWLDARIARFDGALLVISHDRRLLSRFGDFFVAAERGCRHVHGTLAELMASLAREDEHEERRYVRGLGRLLERERHDDALRRRRARKKQVGRVRELARGPSRSRLNENRSYAQESQSKRDVLQRQRIETARSWARAARRALAVELPLELALPRLRSLPAPPAAPEPVVVLDDVAARAGARTLFSGVSLALARERIAITGPNGSGKSTLLEILVGRAQPAQGRVRGDGPRIGYVAQDARNWQLRESLVERIAAGADAPEPDAIARILRAHRFPFALAERPLRSLSPGERLRAALIALCQQRPAPELLVLDEPSDHLDLTGAAALERFLRAWPGGLVLVSHDSALLEAIGPQRYLSLHAFAA